MSEAVVETRGARKVRTGYVISDKMEKTVVVQVSDLTQHPLYKKTIQRRVRFQAHDEENTCGIGDLFDAFQFNRLAVGAITDAAGGIELRRALNGVQLDYRRSAISARARQPK